VALENYTNPVLNKLARALLASSCLTGAAAIATADTIITQGVPPAPAEFPHSPPGYLLPVGTIQVNGVFVACTECGDQDTAWFEFQGLLPGSSFTTFGCCENDSTYALFNSSDVFLGSSNFRPADGVDGTVPTDGNLLVAVSDECGNCTMQNYQVNLDAQLDTPEPSTLATVGLALAGALAWRRKRTRNS
jgi:PEP-CTERM motif